MRLNFLLFIFALTANSFAGENCTVTHQSLAEPTPTDATIAQAFWQKDSDGSENID